LRALTSLRRVQRVRSRPIIEDTVRARFAPYALADDAFAGAAEALAAAGLGEAEAAAWRDAWRNVDDFAWLRATPSPNWAEMAPQERQAPPAPPADAASGAAAPVAAAVAAAADDDEL